MSQTKIKISHYIDTLLTTATTAVLSSEDGTYGVKRVDNDAVVVADGTAMTETSTGVYEYTFTDPAEGLTYEYAVELTYGGDVTRYVGQIEGGVDTEEVYALKPLVRPYVRGPIPDAVLEQMLRKACRQFLKETELWEIDLATITSVADQAAYTLSTTWANTNIFRVLQVKFDDVKHGFKTVADDGTSVTLDPTPTIAGKDIDVRVVLIPKEGLTLLPDWIKDKWDQAMADTCIWLLKSEPGTPWYDPGAINHYFKKYREHVFNGRREKYTERGPGLTEITKRAFV